MVQRPKNRYLFKNGEWIRDWSAPPLVFIKFSAATILEKTLLDRGWTHELMSSRLPSPIEPGTWFLTDVSVASLAKDMPDLLRRGRCISRQALLKRPKWTNSRMKFFLPLPDRIVRITLEGKERKAYLYRIGRIEDVERSPEFNLSLRILKRQSMSI